MTASHQDPKGTDRATGGPAPESRATHPQRETVPTWPFAVLLALAVMLRLALILGVTWSNSSDLRNYFWAGEQVVQGANPYQAWADNLGGPRSDVLPAELALLALLVRIGGTPLAIRLFFVLVDVCVLWALFRYYRGQPRQQLLWFALYAIGPAVLYHFTLTPSDKPLLLGLLLATLLVLQASGARSSVLATLFTALLAAVKWLGLWMILPVVGAAGRQKRNSLVCMGVIGAIFAASHLGWLPSWLVVYQFRLERLSLAPFHASPAVVLQQIGLPMPKLYEPLMIGCWLLVTLAYLAGKLRRDRAAVLSVVAFVIWAPDVTPQMITLLTLMVLLVVNWSTRPRAWLVWATTTWAALMTAAAIGGLWNLEVLRFLSGPYGRLPLAIWVQPMLLIALFWLVSDELRSRSAEDRPFVASLPGSREPLSGKTVR